MFPNPQDALPLPPQPDVEQYQALASELVKSCQSGDPAAIRTWASRWAGERVDQVAQFAQQTLLPDGEDGARCAPADAQLVIARAHGFLSWADFATHLALLASDGSSVAAFESAAQAIVSGDIPALERRLREHPDLIRARSMREHRATLLHYVSANGVEGYRQLSPKNSAEIARILLDAGAEVDAEASVYGSGCTPLGLVATSAPPAIAGVQQDVIDVLLRHGARTDRPGLAGHNDLLVRACLANGQPAAAAYLADRGAPLDLSGAAGLGRLDVVRDFFDDTGHLEARGTPSQLAEAFSMACGYGRAKVVQFLLDRGVEVDVELRDHGTGHTGLHVAAFHGHADVVRVLLRDGARVDAIDKTWGTPPLLWALTGWDRKRAQTNPYHEVVAQLVAAGAPVKPDLLEWDPVRADPKMLAALTGKYEAR